MKVNINDLIKPETAYRLIGISRQGYHHTWRDTGMVRAVRIDGQLYYFKQDCIRLRKLRERKGRRGPLPAADRDGPPPLDLDDFEVDDNDKDPGQQDS